MRKILLLIFAYEKRHKTSRRQDLNVFICFQVGGAGNYCTAISKSNFSFFEYNLKKVFGLYSDGVCVFNVFVFWPNPMVNLKHLHCMWLQSKGPVRMETWHSKIIGFENFFEIMTFSKCWVLYAPGDCEREFETRHTLFFYLFQRESYISSLFANSRSPQRLLSFKARI